MYVVHGTPVLLVHKQELTAIILLLYAESEAALRLKSLKRPESGCQTVALFSWVAKCEPCDTPETRGLGAACGITE